MALKLYNDTDIQNIADAIRSKNGLTSVYKVSEMAAAISAIQTGGSVTAEFVTVTVDADKTAAFNILTGNQFLTAHYADPGAFVFLFSLNNITAADSVVVNMASNIQFANGANYGFGLRTYNGGLAQVPVSKSLASKDAVYNGCMYYADTGKLTVYATTNRILRAGNYAIIMGVME